MTKTLIKTVLLPARNRKDLEEVPEAAREQIEFIWLDTVEDAIAAALESPAPKQVNDPEAIAA